MMRKILILLIISVVLLSCGTDYFYSSFYLSNILDFNWMLSPSDQTDLNFKSTPVGRNFEFTSPSVLGTPDNYILFFYERRNDANNVDIIGVDSANKEVDVYVAISKDAQTFTVTSQLVGGSSSPYSHGSPISFVTKNSEVVVLASSGIGFGGASTSPSLVSKSVSIANGAYRYWSNWEDLPTSVFEPLTNDYDRFYTSPDSGITLGNGTLACIIDYKKSSSSTGNAEGFAILYSKDDGVTWEIGARASYNNTHRFAKIIAEKKDGSLLIAAAANSASSTDYNSSKNLAWFEVDSLNGTIQSISPTGLPVHNCGSTAGGKIKLGVNGYSREAIVLLHSYPSHETTNQNNKVNTVINSTALYISFDEGNKWEMVTNVFYPLTEYTGTSGTIFLYDEYDDKSSFRQSMRILKDGTVAAVSENGGHRIDTSGTYGGFKLVYRRFSLSAISDGKYVYEGL